MASQDFTSTKSRKIHGALLAALRDAAASHVQHEAWLTIRGLARTLGHSERTIQDHRKALIADDWAEPIYWDDKIVALKLRVPDLVRLRAVQAKLDRQLEQQRDLQSDRSTAPPVGSSVSPVQSVVLPSIVVSAAYRQGCCGVSGRYVHAFLAAGPQTRKAIQAAIGYKSARGLRRNLDWECGLGTICTDDGKTYRLADDFPAALALAAQVTGAAAVQERVEARHYVDTAWYRKMDEVRREMDTEAKSVPNGRGGSS